MSTIAVSVLFGWMPFVLWLFTVLPARRAVIVGTLGAWLFLPVGGFNIPGLPDYTKVTATTYSLILGTLLFNLPVFLEFRPRWYDLPMAVWCVVPLFSLLSNGLSLYDGLSLALSQTITWGFPYLIGRLYFNDMESLKELAIGIFCGGLLYMPFCLLEIRMGPILHARFYGYSPRPLLFFDIRFGGYRPSVFMECGLEVGMWMASALTLGYMLWASGGLKRVLGVPTSYACLALGVVFILCKSLGSIILGSTGIGLLWLSRRRGWSVFVWVLILFSPAYIALRGTGLWNGETLVDLASMIDVDRAESLQFRLDNENMLARKALQRPLLGWGGWGRNRVYNDQGDDLTITDGMWIIYLGMYGLIGLTSLSLVMSLPLIRFMRSHPPGTWKLTDIGPAAALAIVVALYSIDSLFNAMFNPVYVTIMGGLMCLRPVRARIREDQPDLVWGDQLRAGGYVAQAEAAYLRALRGPAAFGNSQRALDLRSNAYGRLASLSQGSGRWADAERFHRLATHDLTSLLAVSPESTDLREQLARSYEQLGRCLIALGRSAEAVHVRRQAVQLRAVLAASSHRDSRIIQAWADGLNNLAWLLANGADPVGRDPEGAVGIAEQAVILDPARPTYWNTLGSVYYRCGRWDDAIAALGHAESLGADESSAVNDLFLAMAHHRKGEMEQAASYLAKSESRLAGTVDTQIVSIQSEASFLVDPIAAGSGGP